MDPRIAQWREALTWQTGLTAATITEYVRDTQQFAAWLGARAPVLAPCVIRSYNALAEST